MIFHNLLLRFLFGASTLFLAAGAVVGDVGTGDGAADAGADNGADGGSDATADTTVDDGSQADDSVDPADAVDTQQQQDRPGEDKIDWRTVPQDVRNHLQELKKSNPTLANKIQNAVYTSQSILKAVPGGLKEIQAIKSAIDDAGGVEEIQNLRETHRAIVEEQEDLDRRAASGDVSVLDNLIEVAGDEGFAKLMPAAMQRWLDKSPAEYSHAIGQIMVSALQEGAVVANLTLAQKMLGLNDPEAKKVAMEAFDSVVKWINGVGELASKAPEKPKVDPAIAQQQQQIDSEKTRIFNDRFADRFSSWRNGEILKGLSELAPKGKTFSEYQKSVYVNGVVQELQRVLTSDEDYMKNMQRLHNTRNIDDLMKFTKSRAEKHLPEARKKVYRELFTEATLGSKKPVQPQKPAVQQPKAGTSAAGAQKAWVKIPQGPKPDEIDRSRSDFKMIALRKAAYLKDGRRVFWGDKAPA